VLRISATQCIAYGKPTAVADDCPNAVTPDPENGLFDAILLRRLLRSGAVQEELAFSSTPATTACTGSAASEKIGSTTRTD
jgi:hypothetical protein